MTIEKSLEIRMRNTLKRRGYELMKIRRRDVNAVDYGLYRIVNADTKMLINYEGIELGWSLEEVREWVDNWNKHEK